MIVGKRGEVSRIPKKVQVQSTRQLVLTVTVLQKTENHFMSSKVKYTINQLLNYNTTTISMA